MPFGVILIDGEGTVLFFSETERRESGYRQPRRSDATFSNCRAASAATHFRGRIRQAEETGQVDLEIAWPRDLTIRTRELRIRVQSAQRGGLWLFIERDHPAGPRARG